MKNNKLWYLVKTSLNKKLKSKWFIAINILLLILIVSLINIDNIIKYFGGDFNDPTNVYVISSEDLYDTFKTNLDNSVYLDKDLKLNASHYEDDQKALEKEIKKDEKKDIIVILEKQENNQLSAEVVSYEFISTLIYQNIASALNNTKINYSLLNSSINAEELAKVYEQMKIERKYLSEDLNENEEIMNTIGGVLVPIFIIPIFMLIIMVTSMIGAEINEEKTSKSMEIIISSVSPKTHFLSKMLSANLFILIQGSIILIGGILGIVLRGNIMDSSIIESLGLKSEGFIQTFVKSGIFDNIINAVPFIIIMMLLTFLAYSLLSGILASMTTSMEDYQQLQTPLMIILMLGYYLAIIASAYDSSVFIKVVSFVPFISGILAPVLLVIGQLTYIEIIISTLLLALTNYLLIKYGIKIYKVGILNYSSSKLWKKMFKAVKD